MAGRSSAVLILRDADTVGFYKFEPNHLFLFTV